MASGDVRGLFQFRSLIALPQEIDADLAAINPVEFATPVGEPRRREQQEELLQC